MASIPSSNIVQKWSGGSAWGSWSSDLVYMGYDSSSNKNYVACVRIQMPAAGTSAQFNIKYNYAYSVEQGQKLKYKVTTTAQDSTYVNANSSTAGDATVNMVQGNGTITINYNSSFAANAYIYVYIWAGSSTSYYTQGRILAVSNHACTYTAGTASTVSIGSGTYVGDTCSISITRNNSSFTHTLTWKFGTKTGTIATGVGTSYSFNTSSIASTMSAGIPNANSGTLTVYCTTYNGGTQVGSATSATRSLSLKASTISASGSTIGSAVTLTCARSYSDVTHTLSWSFGGSSGSIASGVGTSQSWTPATATFAPLIPSATSGSCTVTCTTKHGTATVGSAATTTFTLYLPDSVKPSVSTGWYSIAYDNSSSPYPTSGWSCYIQGYSKAKATFTPAKVSAGTGSSISKYRLSIAGGNYDTTGTTATSATLPSSGTVNYTVYVYDARGRYASASGSVTVQAYASPAITSYNIFRCDSGGVADSAGAYFSLTANSTISSVNGNNQRYFVWQMQEVGGAWTGWVGYTNGTTAILGSGTLQAAKSYVVQLRLKDSFATTVYATATIPTDNVTFNLKDGGLGAAFGMYAQTDNVLELASNWMLNTGGGEFMPDTKDILTDALTVQPGCMKCFKGTGSSYTGSVPHSNYGYGTFVVLNRYASTIWVIGLSPILADGLAVNHYTNNAWDGWRRLYSLGVTTKNVSFSITAGTIGTRCHQTSWTSANIGGTPLFAICTTITGSDSFIPCVFIDHNSVYFNAYRATASAVSGRTASITIYYA